MSKDKKQLNQELVMDKALRDETLAKLEAEGLLAKSDIWRMLDTKFETVFGNYMTVKQVAALFDLSLDEKGRCTSLEWYYREDQNPEHCIELKNTGMKFMSYKEQKNLVSTFNPECDSVLSVSN